MTDTTGYPPVSDTTAAPAAPAAPVEAAASPATPAPPVEQAPAVDATPVEQAKATEPSPPATPDASSRTTSTTGPGLVQVTIAGQAVYGFVVDTRDVDASPDLEATQDSWTEALVATLGGDLVLVDAAGVRPVTTSSAQD